MQTVTSSWSYKAIRWYSKWLMFAVAGLLIPAQVSADEPWTALTDEKIEATDWRQPAKSADELVDRLNNPSTAFSSPAAELDEVERGMAIARLRARYPLESIRSRAERLLEFADPISKNLMNNLGTVKPSTPTILYPVKKRGNLRIDSLRELHSDSAEEFIAQPGNGLGRFPIVSPYSLPQFEPHFAGFEATSVSSSITNEPIKTRLVFSSPPDSRLHAKDGVERDLGQSKQLHFNSNYLHRQIATAFASTPSTGFFQSIDEVAGFNAHQIRLVGYWKPIFAKGPLQEIGPPFAAAGKQGEEVTWRVNQVQLVSLLLHDRPMVYLTDQLPNMEVLRSEDTPVRVTDAFETDALKKLASGENIVLEASTNRIRMLGSLRCETSCIDCHTASKEGDVLGAFSYEILRSPVKEADAPITH